MRLDEAENCYRAILSRDAGHADAHHLLGLVAYQTGHHQSAAKLIQKALVLDPANPSMMVNLAMVFNTGGQWAEAEQLCRLGLRENADEPELLHQLAQSLVGQENLDGAQEQYLVALALKPNDVNILNNFATVLIRLSRFEVAAGYLQRAVDVDCGFAMGYANLGSALRNLGELDRAEDACRAALRLEPRNPRALNNLGNVFKDRSDYDQAVDMFQRALQFSPELLEALVNLGSVYGLQGRTAESISILEKAVALNPKLAATYNALALTLLASGDLAAANAAFKTAIAAEPDYVDAYYNLAKSSESEFDDSTVRHLTALLNQPNCLPEQAIMLHFALAEIHKKRQRHAEMFDAIALGNKLRRRRLAEFGHTYDAAEQTKMSAQYRREVSPEVRQNLNAAASDSAVPLFVLGVPRSGTTLVEQILASHPEVHGGGELTFVPEMISALKALGGGTAYPDCLAAVTREELGDAVSGYLSRMIALAPGRSRVIDKSPFNHRYVGLLASLFPNARFIYCRRDARDTGLSCFSQNFTSPLSWSTDLSDIGHYIRDYEKMMTHWKSVLGARIHEVAYEYLAEDPGTSIRQLIEAATLPWDDRCLMFDKSRNVVKTASKWQVREPVYNRAVGQWRNHQAQLAPLIETLGDELGS